MTLTLTPETEARLRRVADRTGHNPDETLNTLLGWALSGVEDETEEATFAALRASEEDFAAGRWISLEDLDARLQNVCESRRKE